MEVTRKAERAEQTRQSYDKLFMENTLLRIAGSRLRSCLGEVDAASGPPRAVRSTELTEWKEPALSSAPSRGPNGVY